MGILVGWLVGVITFPGRIMRVISYRVFFDIMKVEVFEVNYFKGTLIHGAIPSLKIALLIATAPLCVNTILCAFLTFPAAVPMTIGVDNMPPELIFLLWLGVSIGMHAFPDRKYSRHLIDLGALKDQRRSLNVIGQALCLVFGLANILRYFWFDLFYALGISIGASSIAISMSE